MSFLKQFLVFREYRALQKIIASLLVIAELLGALLFEWPQTPRGQKIDLAAWNLVWSDEFDGTALDPAKWRSCGDGPRRGGYWDIGNAIVENGNLILRTDYQSGGRFGPGWYSGAVETQYRYEKTYGYFECRCICPGSDGLWGAFWMFSRGVGLIDGSGADGAEIDIFESPLFGDALKKNAVTHTIHFDGYGADHQSAFLGYYKADHPYTQFNTYGLEWNENECIFYINGVETERIDGKYVSQVDEYMLLSVEVGGNDCVPEKPDVLRNADMIIDYVRVYDRKP